MTKQNFGVWVREQLSKSGSLVFRCAFCNQPTSLSEGSVDHSWPRDLGGRTEWENLLLTCRSCNGQKGAVGDREFHELLILITAWPARRSEDPIEQQRLRLMGDSVLRRLGHGENPLLRIALCGYEGEHAIPDSWECVPWKASGGYGTAADAAGRVNASRERIWFSPACLKPQQGRLF